jgi:hypothetical protein
MGEEKMGEIMARTFGEFMHDLDRMFEANNSRVKARVDQDKGLSSEWRESETEYSLLRDKLDSVFGSNRGKIPSYAEKVDRVTTQKDVGGMTWNIRG